MVVQHGAHQACHFMSNWSETESQLEDGIQQFVSRSRGNMCGRYSNPLSVYNCTIKYCNHKYPPELCTNHTITATSTQPGDTPRVFKDRQTIKGQIEPTQNRSSISPRSVPKYNCQDRRWTATAFRHDRKVIAARDLRYMRPVHKP